MNNKNPWYSKWLSLLKLETTTKHGRVNLGGVIIVTVFCLAYSASDTLRHFISALEGVFQTLILKEVIHYEYESVGLEEIVLPIIFVFVFCLLFLAWHEKRKDRIKQKNK